MPMEVVAVECNNTSYVYLVEYLWVGVNGAKLCYFALIYQYLFWFVLSC